MGSFKLPTHEQVALEFVKKHSVLMQLGDQRVLAEELSKLLDRECELAEKGFAADMGALKWCDACVLLLPCGKSAHLEMGWATGAGKKTILFAQAHMPTEPELMYKMFDHFCISMGEVLAALNDT